MVDKISISIKKNGVKMENLNNNFERYMIGQRNQCKNYFIFSAEWIGISLTILTLLWGFGNIITLVSYMLLIAFVSFVNNVAVNSKVIHEIDEGQFKELEDLHPWINLAEFSYALGTTFVLASFMIIFYAAMDESILAPSVFLISVWIFIILYNSTKSKVNKRKQKNKTKSYKNKGLLLKGMVYLIEVGIYILLILDYLNVYDWISALA